MKKILFAIFLIINTGLYSQNTYTINTGSYYYTPSSLTIDVGDSVIWINDGGYHDVNGNINSITNQPFNNPVTFDSPSTSTVGAVIFGYKFILPGTYNYDCSVGSHASAGMVGSVIVNSQPPQTYVPDNNFEAYLEANGMGNGIANDDSVTTSNIVGITSLDVSSKAISDLTGIEDFTSLTNLDCSSNQLTILDVSQNTALTSLDCFTNQLTNLDVSQNLALTELNCGNNQLTSLDVSQITALYNLDCFTNQLTNLDVSQNLALTELDCYDNQLTNLDVSQNTALTSLDCGNNQLTSLNVSQNTALTALYCNYNQLTSLDVSQNTALTRLYCNNNQLTSLDVSQNTALTYLNCSANSLTSLDVSNNLALINLSCDNNDLSCLNLKNGYNSNLYFNAIGNDSLTCIEVDNIAYSTAAWTFIDPQTSFSLDCIGCGCNTVYVSDTLNTNVSDIQYQNISPQTYLAILDTFPQFSNPNCDSVVSTYRQFIYNPNYCTDTILTYDTLTTYDTVFNQIYDTTIVFDTLNISVIDTSYISISVTDTLYIDITVTGMTSMDNTITVYPNPANDVVIIDNGNYSIMNNYNLMIFNSLSQQVFFSPINTQQFQIPVSSLGAEGTYFIQIFDSSNNLIKTKYLILN